MCARIPTWLRSFLEPLSTNTCVIRRPLLFKYTEHERTPRQQSSHVSRAEHYTVMIHKFTPLNSEEVANVSYSGITALKAHDVWDLRTAKSENDGG